MKLPRTRRQMLKLLGATPLVPLIGCTTGTTSSGDDDDDDDGTTPDAQSGECSQIPEETAGPYPGDGSNGANALALAGIVRSDIRSSIDGASGTAEGIPLTLTLTLVDTQNSCAPLAGYAIYLWHCDRDGNYSMYSSAIADENYLRGVQATDSSGRVTFTSIFPGCYSGRWPHIHFEVFPSIDVATSSSNKVATSQLAFPQDACEEAYATSGYETSVSNLAQASLSSDNVFRDGAELQLATVSGNASDGYTATLLVSI